MAIQVPMIIEPKKSSNDNLQSSRSDDHAETHGMFIFADGLSNEKGRNLQVTYCVSTDHG